MPPLPPVPEDDEDLDFYKILMTRWELPRQPSCYVAKTARGREKQLEKDLPWGMIPVEQHAAFREAEAKQYKEHLDRDALEPLPLEAIMRDEPERILSALRLLRQGKEKGPDGPLEAQGQAGDWGTHGPRHWSGLNTMAPTVSRQSVLLLLQRAGRPMRRHHGGLLERRTLTRELYLRQPRTGLGDLRPNQLLRIKKGVSGLVDSLHGWWERVKDEVTSLRPETEDGEKFVEQCPLDPCVFFVKNTPWMEHRRR